MIEFILGEDKHIEFTVHSKEQKEVIVESATYELRRLENIEASGDCELIKENEEETVLRVKLSPREKGNYHLEITYYVADETLKHIEKVQVL